VNALVPLSPPSSPALPVLVAATGDRAGVSLPEFFATQIRDPPAPPPRLRAGGGRVLVLVRDQGRGVADCGSAPACGGLDRTRGAGGFRAEREAVVRRHPVSVRLAGHRPGSACESGGLGARAAPCGAGGQDCGAGTGLGAGTVARLAEVFRPTGSSQIITLSSQKLS